MLSRGGALSVGNRIGRTKIVTSTLRSSCSHTGAVRLFFRSRSLFLRMGRFPKHQTAERLSEISGREPSENKSVPGTTSAPLLTVVVVERKRALMKHRTTAARTQRFFEVTNSCAFVSYSTRLWLSPSSRTLFFLSNVLTRDAYERTRNPSEACWNRGSTNGSTYILINRVHHPRIDRRNDC